MAEVTPDADLGIPVQTILEHFPLLGKRPVTCFCGALLSLAGDEFWPNDYVAHLLDLGQRARWRP